MKNLLTKILFISLLLSTVVPFGAQACFLTDIGEVPARELGAAVLLQQAVKMGQEITKIAVSKAAQEGQRAIPIEVVAIAVALPVVAIVVKTARTGDAAGAVAAGERAIQVMLESAKLTGIVMVAGAIVVSAGKVLTGLRS